MKHTRMTPEMQELLSDSLYELGLDERTVNHMAEIGVMTIEDLLHRTESELRRISHVGDRTMEKIFTSLAKRGFVRYPPVAGG